MAGEKGGEQEKEVASHDERWSPDHHSLFCSGDRGTECGTECGTLRSLQHTSYGRDSISLITLERTHQLKREVLLESPN